MGSLLDAARARKEAQGARQALTSSAGRKPLSPELFKKFSEFIYQISGIRFQDSKAYFLSSKLDKRCQDLSLENFEEYYNYLQRPGAKQTEYHKLLDEITINETFFFRNQPQLEVFEKHFLIPSIQKRRGEGRNKMRIWSCASSTGDEAYTTALQILSLPEARGMQFEIIGTDICRDAIEKAKKAAYKKYGVRNIPKDLMAKYFTTSVDGHTFELSNDVKTMVRFQECNLMDSDRIRMLGQFDIAFCRNVLIYFDDDSKEVALKNIYNALKDDGFLIAGHSENLYSYRHIFKAVKEHSQAHAYVKAPPGQERSRI